MSDSAISSPPALVPRPNGDIAEAAAHLERLTWTMRIVRLGLAVRDDMAAHAAELQGQATELEAAVDELRESERRERQLADESALLARRLVEAQRVAKLGYWEIDSATNVVFWSDEMYALSGFSPSIKPPPSEQYLERVHPDDRQRLMDAAAEARRSSREFTEHYRLRALDGAHGWRFMQADARVVANEHGERKLVGIVQDITDRAALDLQLRRSQKMEAVGQLAGGIAHDVHNILTVIDGFSSLLLSNQEPDRPHRADIEEIRNAAARASTLTRQLLAFSRQQVLPPRILDLNETIGGIENMLRRLIGEHIHVETRLGSGLELIKADPGQLEQVIINLVVNARDAMPDGGRLTIETSNAALPSRQSERAAGPSLEHFVVLSIADTGVGIPPENIDRIYEPFFTTKENEKGTGLGLSSVLEIVEQSGGQIRLSTQVGKGTVFTVYFPRTEGRVEASARRTSQETHAKGSETILLVEDDAAVRNVAAATLRRAGYAVIEYRDGPAALERCEDVSLLIDLLVTDMVMPAMGGRDLANRLRARRPDVPVLFMSGYTRDAMIHSAVLRHGESFVEKPFTPGILTQKVRDALDASGDRDMAEPPPDRSERASAARSARRDRRALPSASP